VIDGQDVILLWEKNVERKKTSRQLRKEANIGGREETTNEG
jgi:hypothetical protein